MYFALEGLRKCLGGVENRAKATSSGGIAFPVRSSSDAEYKFYEFLCAVLFQLDELRRLFSTGWGMAGIWGGGQFRRYALLPPKMS